MPTEPTLADDEARLAEIAAALDTALRERVPEWLRRRAADVAPGVDARALDRAVEATMADLGPELHRVLTADVDDGAGSPLAAIRAATGRVNRVLEDAGAPAPTRDDFDERAFPHDRYGLGPASFADIHDDLHEPGLVWGAARAHVHLRRRRER